MNAAAKMSQKVNLIVAVDSRMGIGKGNSLPWRLPKDFSYFVRKVRETQDPTKQNMVLMGRKNWESIPVKHRPLKGLVNVVLSRNMTAPPYEGVPVCDSMEKALSLAKNNPQIETVWNIGGAEIYRLGLETCDRLYITRIQKDYECDVFFPEVNWANFKEIQDPTVPPGIVDDNDVALSFHVYERIIH